MLAITLHGPNLQGFPEDYPKVARENADSLLPGEAFLMDEEEYKVWHEQKYQEHKAAIDAIYATGEQTDLDVQLRVNAKITLASLNEENLKLRAVVRFLIQQIKVAVPTYNVPTKNQIINGIRNIIDDKSAD